MDAEIPAGSLVLRIWQTGDEEALTRIRDTSAAEFGDWLPGATRDLADIPAYIEQVASAYRERTGYFYAVVEAGEPVGQCSLHFRDPGVAEIGYWIRTERTGRGLATAAVTAVAAHALADGVRELVIHCDAGNARSAAVASKAGFTHVGTVELDPTQPGTPVQTGREMTWVRSGR